jgi:hypothetical protein
MPASRMAKVRVERCASATGQPSVLDRLGDVRRPYRRAAAKIGYGAGDPEDAVPGARREMKALTGLLEQSGAGRVRGAQGVDRARVEARIRFLLAFMLTGQRGFDAFAHGRRRFAIGLAVKRLDRQCRNFDQQVDAVEKGAGQLAAIAGDLIRRAPAFSVRVAAETAGAGIHRGDQLELGRKFGVPRGTGDVDAAGFERLAQGFQHLAVEFREFVEEHHALMSQ